MLSIWVRKSVVWNTRNISTVFGLIKFTWKILWKGLLKVRRNRNRIRKYFSLLTRGPDGFESWNKTKVENLFKHFMVSLLKAILNTLYNHAQSYLKHMLGLLRATLNILWKVYFKTFCSNTVYGKSPTVATYWLDPVFSYVLPSLSSKIKVNKLSLIEGRARGESDPPLVRCVPSSTSSWRSASTRLQPTDLYSLR